MIQQSLSFVSATTTRILLWKLRKNNQIIPPWLPRRGGVFRMELGSFTVSMASARVKPRSPARFSCVVKVVHSRPGLRLPVLPANSMAPADEDSSEKRRKSCEDGAREDGPRL